MASFTLRSRVLAGGIALLVCSGIVPSRAQSLADVARKEGERRKEVKEPAKVYTNKDLASVPPASTSPPAAEATEPPKDTAAAAAKEPEKDKEKDSKKDKAYWADRLKDLQTQLDRDQMFADALQSRINALTTDFTARDDPAQRAVIERDRQKALSELDRVKKQIVKDKKAIDDFQEEARRAGVPPGWLR